ncbi:MAG: CBS domain-containing protein [Phycisphaerales bacterium JB059]
MQSVRELIAHKGSTVHSVSVSGTVLEAARVMNDARVGALVVLDEGAMVGILSERDILTRVVAAERDPSRTLVSQVMTREVLTCAPETRIGEARHVMRERRVRHLPVVDQGQLLGMLSIGDLNLVENETLVETIRHMEAYISGGASL